MGYEPMNQPAIDYLEQTPLSKIDNLLETTNPLALAKFKVVFFPPGIIEMYSLRGFPLIWLGLIVSAVILGTSLLLSITCQNQESGALLDILGSCEIVPSLRFLLRK